MATSAGRAFTLVEMLVAIGAIALVSIGLAAVFQTVGKTVTTGKRVSALTQQAAVLESQMREDFENMTRDGFLVLRHQFTIGGTNAQQDPVPIAVSRYQGDPVAPRPRRIDEILFFANGEYRTAREDLIPGRTAKSRSARIYYGHGQKASPVTPAQEQENNSDIHYFSPWFADWFRASTSSRLGETRGSGISRYASTWNLVRQATLLIRPTTPSDGGWPVDRPRPSFPGDPYASGGQALTNLSSDSTFQIAGQPAANSIFRSLNEMLPMTDRQYGGQVAKNFAFFWDRDRSSGGDFNVQGVAPRSISGVVDIASTDLDEIAMVVNGSRYSPNDQKDGSFLFGPRTLQGIGVLEAPIPLMKGFVNGIMVNGKQVDPSVYQSSYVTAVQPRTQSAFSTTAARMQSWMLNAMPAPSGYHPTIWNQDVSAINTGDGLQGRVGFRIRCEDVLPDVRGTLDRFTNRAVQTKRNDLLMVGLSKIAANCSEFVVEWSFGQTYPPNTKANDPITGKLTDFSNQTIWYGRTIYGANGQPTGVYHYQRPGSAEPYPQFPDSALGLDLSYKPFKGDPEWSGVSTISDYVVPEWLVHGVYKRNIDGFDKLSLISYFGYLDPTYKKQNTNEPPSIPWAWPKMIRVTFTLADAADPSIEQTFQYVFDLPPGPKL
ncbi:MAG: prepilin-type N-terminal cleavage/methylation domain-containing protein [Phycisphaeraceae bacterium]|nr:prepilin-type N-terminal cleavage/methylation domain-containing protein [Phycisphaeraceae bacterium]